MIDLTTLLFVLTATQDRPKPAPKAAPTAEQEKALKDKALAGKPIDKGQIDSAIQRGIVLLLAAQESLDPAVAIKAEWPYEGVYRADENGKPHVIPIGYRVGGTSIAGLALIEASDGKPRAEVRAALERALAFVLAELDEP